MAGREPLDMSYAGFGRRKWLLWPLLTLGGLAYVALWGGVFFYFMDRFGPVQGALFHLFFALIGGWLFRRGMASSRAWRARRG